MPSLATLGGDGVQAWEVGTHHPHPGLPLEGEGEVRHPSGLCMEITNRSSADHVAELEDRQIHRDHHAADDGADDDHDERFEQARQRVDRVVDLLLVKLGDLEQHRIERAGLFTDADHLYDHVRKQFGLAHRELQLMADGDVFANLLHRFVVDWAASRGRYRIERFDKRHASLEGHAQRAREARDRRLSQDLPDDGDLERGARDEMRKFRRTFVYQHCADNHADDAYDQYQPMLGDEARHANVQQGERRKLGAEVLEYGLKLRNYEDQQDHGHDEGDCDHRGRVVQSLLDLALDRLDVFLVGRHGVEHRVEHARG